MAVSKPVLRVGTRGSKLALVQTSHVIAYLQRLGLATAVVTIRTTGDRRHQPLYGIGVKGVFIKEIEQALHDRSIDIAVHSAKDLPTELSPEFVIVAYLPRATPWDVWIAPHDRLETIPPGARVGTSSLRRMAMIRWKRPDVAPVPIRGNVDTRLRKLETGQYDAIVMAAAGLERLGWMAKIREVLRPPEFVPAAGQGAIAVEIRRDSPWWDDLRQMDDPATRQAVETERAVIRRLRAGCHAPVGVYATAHRTGTRWHIRAQARCWLPNGRRTWYAVAEGSSPETVAETLVTHLQAQPEFQRWYEGAE